MIRSVRIWLWGLVAELEYQLYPWKTSTPPEWVKPEHRVEPDYEQNLNYDWLKSHDEKIGRLQQEMLWVQQEIHKLNVEYKTHD